MTPPKTPQDKHDPKDLAEKRACNTPENATRAVATSRECLSSLKAGRAWNHRAPRGEFEVKGGLLIEDRLVAVLHFNPDDTSLLPRGLHALSSANEEALKKVESRLHTIPRELSILDGAEFREPEFCWAVPLAHQGRIVGHIKVSADGSTVVVDRKASDEMASALSHP